MDIVEPQVVSRRRAGQLVEQPFAIMRWVGKHEPADGENSSRSCQPGARYAVIPSVEIDIVTAVAAAEPLVIAAEPAEEFRPNNK
jgi:hypothetical protein